MGGKPTLATVNGEPITLDEFDLALAGIHERTTDNVARSRARASELLERLITTKLVVQEARNIGIDGLPEVVQLVKAFEEDLLRGTLSRQRAGQVKQPDGKEVEKRYRGAIREDKIASVLIEKEEDGRRIEAEVKAGADFGEAAKRLIEAGAATGSAEGRYMKHMSLSPEISGVVSAMKKGECSPLIRVGSRFTMLKLEDVRFPEDRDAREKARKEALQAKRAAAWKSYVDGLMKKYLKVNRKLLEKLDYESPEPGIEKLSADRRVLAEVQGEKPVLVKDLTESLQKKFFHGAEGAAQRKKINVRKEQVLEDILLKRVVLKEARRKGLDRSQHFKMQVEDFRNGVLFGYFIQKVVDPDVKVEEAEGAAYYESHIGDFTMPEKVRIESIAFSSRSDAEDAVEKLRKGADFQWLQANATGRADPDQEGSLIESRDTLVMAADLPEGLRKAISGADEGEYRLYGETGGPFYAIRILEREPARPQPYEDVRIAVEKMVFQENREKMFRDWERKLRNASEVKVFAAGENLDRLVRPKAR